MGADCVSSAEQEEETASSSEKSSSPTNAPRAATPAEVAIADVATKQMAGELEVSVLWDHSHRYLSGMRTIVRFRMVG